MSWLTLSMSSSRLNFKMAEFLWPYVSGIVPRLVEHPASCKEAFNLTEFLILRLLPKLSPVLDLAQLADQCCNLLLESSSSEVPHLSPHEFCPSPPPGAWTIHLVARARKTNISVFCRTFATQILMIMLLEGL